ncbi:MAG: hypothetical protein HY900_34085 [Deltaproteobacteria bacterium]|nr:hypothetical protein [Deltaproteobacteria bacterium]
MKEFGSTDRQDSRENRRRIPYGSLRAVVARIAGALAPALAAAALLAALPACAITYIHQFPPDPGRPHAPLVSDGAGNLYGTTRSGSAPDNGIVFTIKTDGTGFAVLHAFAGGAAEGRGPGGRLILEGGFLYGTTAGGGASNNGTIFKLKTDGTLFATLHSFAGAPADGASPLAGLTSDGAGNLYGTTQSGGASGNGAVFTIQTGGAGYGVVYSLGGGAEGAYPLGELALDGAGNLYGTTSQSGASSKGTIFKVSTDGLTFSVLHAFAGAPADGSDPEGGLLLLGGTLYGTTRVGGASDQGSVFSISTSGGAITILHSFAGGPADGQSPRAAVLVSDGVNLYGVTESGGPSDLGTVFSITPDGVTYTVLRSFAGAPADGRSPAAGVIVEGGNLYGTNDGGGAWDSGAIFRMTTAGGGFTLLRSFAGKTSDGANPRAGLVLDGAGYLYGTTQSDGVSNAGGIFKVKTDGTAYAVLHDFSFDLTNGREAYGALVFDGVDNLYGTTYSGGASDSGTVFTIKTNGTGFTLLRSFAGGPADGANPRGRLLLDGDNLYGTTSTGGTTENGVAFTLKTSGIGYTIIHDFVLTASEPADPWGGLVLDGAGNLYGTTYSGGASGYGTVFTMTTTGAGFTVLHEFDWTATDAAEPRGELVLDGMNLYGTTESGSPGGYGKVYTLTTGGAGFTLLHSFTGGADGSHPYAGLLLGPGGNLYGTARDDAAGYGTAFTLTTAGAAFQVLQTFTDTPDGSNPEGGLILDGSTLYGTTSQGGAPARGTVFSVSNPVPVELMSFTVE